MYSVYALTDPRDESIRYIGMSKNVWRRYAMHLLVPTKTAKSAWVEELRKLDLSPLLTVLETVETEEKARSQEAYWIRYHLSHKTPLVNMARGGPRSTLVLIEEAPFGDFLTVEEIAEASGVSTYTVIRLIKSGQLVAYKVSGTWRITSTDLQRYLDAQRSTKSPDQES